MPNEIIAGLNNFSSYLRGENELRKKEFDKEKQKIAAERVTTGFKSLTADNTESDARQLVYNLINDAASLDSLDATLPLIDSLYRDTTNAIKQQKLDKQDKALGDYAKSINSNLPSGLSGTQAFDVAKYEDTQKKDFKFTDKAGQDFLKIYDRKGNVVQTYTTNEQTDKEQQDLKLQYEEKLARYQHGLNSNKIVGYPGLTENNLPLVLTEDGLKVQIGGKLVMYDERVHGGVVRGTSQGKPYADAKAKLDLLTKENKSLYLQSGTQAKEIAKLINAPTVTNSQGVEDYNLSLDLSFRSPEALWSAIRKTAVGNNEQELQLDRARLYNDVYLPYKETRNLYKNSVNDIQMSTVEEKYDLGTDNFAPLNDTIYKLLDENISSIPQNSSPGEVNKMVENKLITQNQGFAWLEKNLLREEATRNGRNLSSNKDYQDFYNNLGYDAKGQLFSKLRKK